MFKKIKEAFVQFLFRVNPVIKQGQWYKLNKKGKLVIVQKTYVRTK